MPVLYGGLFTITFPKAGVIAYSKTGENYPGAEQLSLRHTTLQPRAINNKKGTVNDTCVVSHQNDTTRMASAAYNICNVLLHVISDWA